MSKESSRWLIASIAVLAVATVISVYVNDKIDESKYNEIDSIVMNYTMSNFNYYHAGLSFEFEMIDTDFKWRDEGKFYVYDVELYNNDGSSYETLILLVDKNNPSVNIKEFREGPFNQP